MAFSAATNFTLLSNLQSLANGAAKGLGRIGTAGVSYLDDSCSVIKVTTGATASNNGSIELFLVASDDGTNFTDNIDPNATTSQDAKIAAASLNQLVWIIGAGGKAKLDPATSYWFPGFSVVSILGYRPVFWAPVILNKSGGPLSANAGDFLGIHAIQT
jgi:hypothetical protein